jgi:NADPH2:quinone reductase
MQVIRIHQTGGPEVMRLEEAPTPKPGQGQVLVRLAAAGVNFIDIYHRSGQYKMQLPFDLGREGAGTVEAAGPGVADVKVGDRVAWAGTNGSYATHVLVTAADTVPVPENVRLEDAAAAMLQGMTAHYLSHSTYPLKQGDSVLIHAAAGGVGQLLCQMARMLGANPIIGTTSTEEKAALAREAGAHEVILYTQQDFEAETKRLTGGQGVHVVYDSVGKDTFDKSLKCLRPRGYLVLFGGSSGPVPPFDPIGLMAGSWFLTRPTLAHYTQTREELLSRARELFDWIGSGKLKLRIDRTYPLTEAARAHTDLASRKTAGKLILTV